MFNNPTHFVNQILQGRKNGEPERYMLWRECERTGYNKTVVYTGPLSKKPAGWKVAYAVS